MAKKITIYPMNRPPAVAKRRTGKPVKTPTFLPIPRESIVLGIDSGATPGYGILDSGDYVQSGVAIEPERREYAVRKSRELSLRANLPLLFISENWPSAFLPNGKRMSHESILGMGMNWGLWLQEILKLPKQIYILERINVLDWRKFYGISRCNKAQAKRFSLPLASQIANKTITDHNEAEGILIAKVGCYLRKKQRRSKNV